MSQPKVLRIVLKPSTETEQWPVFAELTMQDGEAYQCDSQMLWEDTDNWERNLPSNIFNPDGYGRYLGKALFYGKVNVLCQKAINNPGVTHLHLLIDNDELKDKKWGLLHYLDEVGESLSLAIDQRLIYSFYPKSISPRIYPVLSRKDLCVLSFICSPLNPPIGFSGFDAAKRKAEIEVSLNEIPHKVIFKHEDTIWENLLENLSTGLYSVLHITSYGFSKHDFNMSYLIFNEGEEVRTISNVEFINSLRSLMKLPSLIIFDGLGTDLFASDLIAKLGTPFVISPDADALVTIDTVSLVYKKFYKELFDHGMVDLSLAKARYSIRKRRDFSNIVLYQKQAGVPLFYKDDEELPSEVEPSSNKKTILGRVADVVSDKLKDSAYKYIADRTPNGIANHIINNAAVNFMQLQIKHNGCQDAKPLFNVKRLPDGKDSKAVTLVPPDKIAMEGMVEGAESNLQQELHWYLEEFPGSLILNEKGYKKFAAQANHVEEYLEKWGKECFSQLFQDNARDWFQDAAYGSNLKKLRLKISSDDPKILAWPWEALRDWDGKPLAQLCHIERQLNNVSDPLPLVDNLPQNCINILLVIARPKGERDVSFHALSRPLLELIHKEQLPIRLDVLRPPTFNQLRHTLHNKPGYYHIVHFDGHGAYQTDQQQGVLLFENDAGEANSVNADTLATLLHEHRIPVMILNACQSAQIHAQAEDAFASVAASLLKAGIRSVVAMGYVLYVGGAKHFVPAFYRRLVESGDVGEALRAGRQAMLADNMRVVSAYEYPLQDWLVPVLYQQLPQNEHVLPKLVATAAVPIPPEIKDIPALGAYGFIGRESMVQKLERALLRQRQASILIHGLKGIGKTTLLIGFMQWLRDTNGLPAHFHWFDFSKVSSLSQVADKLLAALPNMGAASLPIEQKLDRLVGALQTAPHLLVWDNFEVAGGNSAAGIAPQLPADELALLKNFFRQLRNGKVNETKILLASDQPETWLEYTECFRLKLDGLETDECWEFANAVLADIDPELTVKRTNQDFKFLLEDLGAHPLAMQRALPHLERVDTSAIHAFRQTLRDSASSDTSDTARLIWAAMKL